MSLQLPSFVGTIRIEPRLVNCAECVNAGCESDDSTLDLLLASFAHREALGDDQWIASRRLSWVAPPKGNAVLRANLAQLLDDLQTELDQLDRVAT